MSEPYSETWLHTEDVNNCEIVRALAGKHDHCLGIAGLLYAGIATRIRRSARGAGLKIADFITHYQFGEK